ncbi:hypothetical protein D1814_03540 [Alteromonas sp. BL110]|uniref:hypothetical protein n=1 Tax=Alteromonas sp. BL110 TaxID=1714845 RepID=UPI000E4B7380|nr:hypothetical protein [Alteromonas sp. BL110]AXT37813.1 hypothetical protein D1814_03540 [Alteromonas sp. BL110]RKM80553.1 hypothetical protein D7031_16885 [Alteromonas sp. BL110]
MLEQQRYHRIREHMQPGDIIAFGGNSLFSRWTKLTTHSPVTHVAVVTHTKVTHTAATHTTARDDAKSRYYNHVTEATFFRGKRGVMTNRLSERVASYDGDIWWLPLSRASRSIFEQNKHKFFNFMCEQEGKPYDILQLFGSAVDALDDHPLFSSITYNNEDFSSWFCSELIAEGLKTAGVVTGVNSSEVTPVDICRFNIFKKRYVQLKGEGRIIEGFNTLVPDNWGQIA